MRTILYTARGLAAVWAGFWIWLGLASGIAEGMSLAGIAIHTAVPGLLFLLIAAIAWEWQLTGGILLVAISLVVGVSYPLLFHNRPIAMQLSTAATLALPPLAAGLLLLIHLRLKASARAATAAAPEQG